MSGGGGDVVMILKNNTLRYFNGAYTVLNLSFDGDAVDRSAGATETHTPTVYSDATFSDTVKRFGSHSVRYNGPNGFIFYPSSVDFALGSVFTVSFWARQNAFDDVVRDFFGIGPKASGFIFGRYNSSLNLGKLYAQFGGVPFVINYVYNTALTWQHFKLTLENELLKVYVNNVVVDTVSVGAVSVAQGYLYTGVSYGGGYFTGYMDNFSLHKGVVI